MVALRQASELRSEATTQKGAKETFEEQIVCVTFCSASGVMEIWCYIGKQYILKRKRTRCYGDPGAALCMARLL